MNKTNLSHWAVSIKIFLAIKQAVKTGICQDVLNRKNEPFLRITYNRGEFNALQFWDKRQNNVTELVLSVLRTIEA